MWSLLFSKVEQTCTNVAFAIHLLHTIQYIQYILNWPLPIGAFQGQWNTTKRQNRTTTTVKNPNWPEANQLAIYKCGWEVEPGTTRIKFNEWSERVLNPGSPDLKASALTTGPHCLHICYMWKSVFSSSVMQIDHCTEILKADVSSFSASWERIQPLRPLTLRSSIFYKSKDIWTRDPRRRSQAWRNSPRSYARKS